jgi:ribosomal protein S26
MALRAIAVGHGCKNAFLLQSSEGRMVPVLNILLCKMYAKIPFCIKCIFATIAGGTIRSKDEGP